ncbi:NAD-dependent epimerase/dehydratase family protein [Entomospira entomophila]|uniref:NAD-dependent epimerase/dehydratase family protein n=1 Tax=Entomospira entomophila TaxID=2719988 RepID=A0A968GBB8_9SPIO|nr:NAD-dependent epimerase/dehydratase family protein [Entomospira entomophilus]NIZ41245.1 NAD-dependent epimerase/dehydratase family protein [Entomospira entomophilus]WDI35450.1 NAD-dependent epimerase/dehydratase family protein [Entomospira entomophilus]
MVFITGASGLVGCALIMELYQQGVRKIRVLINRNNNVKTLLEEHNIQDLNVEYVFANLIDKEALIHVMGGVTEVYHLAALISIVPGIYPKLYETNVIGVENLIAASKVVGVKKIIHLSSVEAIGYKKGEMLLNESAGFRPDNAFIEYGKTKAIGAIKALELAQEAKIPLVILAPAGIIGPYDYTPSRLGQFIWDSSQHKLPAYIDGSFDFVDSRDVATLAYQAMQNAPAYEVYICSGTHATLDHIITTVVEQTHVKKPPKIARPLAKILAFFFELIYKLGGPQPLLTSGSLRITHAGISYDSSKAQRDLQWKIRPLDHTILETLSWLQKRETNKTIKKHS